MSAHLFKTLIHTEYSAVAPGKWEMLGWRVRSPLGRSLPAEPCVHQGSQMSKNKYTARISGAAISVYSNTRLGKGVEGGLYDRACMALEQDGMPMPMDATKKSWVRSKLDHIYTEVKKSHPGQFKNLRVPNCAFVKITQSGPTLSRRSKLPFVATDAFLQTYEWRKLRMEALKKYTPRCMCCGATPATGAVMNVDHIKPRRLFPSLAMDINNLQILCHDCNHGKGNWDQTDWRT